MPVGQACRQQQDRQVAAAEGTVSRAKGASLAVALLLVLPRRHGAGQQQHRQVPRQQQVQQQRKQRSEACQGTDHS
jgi:hypothetical protein